MHTLWKIPAHAYTFSPTADTTFINAAGLTKVQLMYAQEPAILLCSAISLGVDYLPSDNFITTSMFLLAILHYILACQVEFKKTSLRIRIIRYRPTSLLSIFLITIKLLTWFAKNHDNFHDCRQINVNDLRISLFFYQRHTFVSCMVHLPEAVYPQKCIGKYAMQ